MNKIKEELFTLVDMDDETADNAVKLAKKAGLKPKVVKTKTGKNVSVNGPMNKVMKYMQSLPEDAVDRAKEMQALKDKHKREVDQEKQDIKRLKSESYTSYKNIISEMYGKNFEALCAAMKVNKIQKDILKDYMTYGKINAQYVGRVAGDRKEKRIYAGKKPYKGQLSNKKEALYSALKLNGKQKSILSTYIKSGNIVGKYTGSVAGSTKETKKYAGIRNFKEHFEVDNG